MSTSIKKNFIYNSILTLSLYIFPLLTFPYVTRTLGVDRIGACDFVNSIVDYFCVLSMMGMSQMGVREIARAKDNREALSKTFSSLLLLNIAFTVLSIAVLFILINVVPQFREYNQLLYIGSAKILFNTLVIEWLYRGLENFNYVTIRTIVVRFLYVIAVFLLINSPDDYILYFTLSVIMVVVNAAINIVYSRRFISIVIDLQKIKGYITPFFKLGIYQILTAMYTSLNVFFLGMFCGTIEVGYYTTAVKLYSIVIAMYGAFTGVMIPRMSVYLEQGNYDEFYKYISKSIGILLLFAMPMVIISEVFADDIVNIIAGAGYEGAVLPMMIIIPLMIVVGLEQILIAQILLPLRKDNAILVNSIAGAITALAFNFLLVPSLGAVGSAIVWVLSELVVLTSAQYYLKKNSIYTIDAKMFLKYLLLALPISLFIWFIHTCINTDSIFFSIMFVAFSAVIAYAYFGLFEVFLFKNPLLIYYITKIIRHDKTNNSNTNL